MKSIQTRATLLILLAGVASHALADDGRWKVAKPKIVADTFADTQWTQRDNLGDINWHDAKAHCANLDLDGGGWRLPTMSELSQLYSGAGNDNVPCGAYQGTDFTCRAPRHFYLTGPGFWSGEQGKSSSEAWYFLLSNGTRLSEPVSFSYFKRALCVRRGS